MPASQPTQQPQAPRTYDMREAATLLNTGRTRLLRWLREHKYLCKTAEGNMLPNRHQVDAGYLTTKIHRVELGGSGITILRATTRVTEKGIFWLQKKFEQERNA